MIKNNKKILTMIAITVSAMMFSPALNSKVQAKTIVQTIKDSKGNEDAKKLSSKLQYLFNNLKRVEYKDRIKESDGAKRLLKWLEQYFVNNKLEIENYINSNKEFSKGIATLYRSCLNKRKSIYSKYASKFNMEIPTDIVAKSVVDKAEKKVTSVKPDTDKVEKEVKKEVKKEVVQVKPVVDKADKEITPVKPITNEVNKEVASIKPVLDKVEKEVTSVKSITNNADKKVIQVKPVANEVKKKVASIKPVEKKVTKVKSVIEKLNKEVTPVKPVVNKIEKKVVQVKPITNKIRNKVTPVKPVTNNDKKQTSKDLNKVPQKAKLPKTGSNVGGLALGIIGAITTMFGILVSKVNRK